MSVVTATIDIAAPPSQVWEVVMNPDCLGDWVTIHRALLGKGDGPPRVGFEMQQSIQMRGAHFKVKWELVDCDAPRRAIWEGRGPARSRARTEYRLSEQDGGTHFDYRNEFHPPMGPLGAAASRALMGGMPEREANRTLMRLKHLIESH